MYDKKYYLKTKMNESPPIYIFLGMCASIIAVILIFSSVLYTCDKPKEIPPEKSAYNNYYFTN